MINVFFYFVLYIYSNLKIYIEIIQFVAEINLV